MSQAVLVPPPAAGLPALARHPGAVVPRLVADCGEQAGWRYVEFFAASIPQPEHAARLCPRLQPVLRLVRAARFAAGDDPAVRCRRLHRDARSRAVAAEREATLAAIRMLFDWLVVGQVMPSNPASSVLGPKHVVKTGKTPVLDGAEWRRLMDAIPVETMRDRALIAVLTYSFARIGAALAMRVEDVRAQGAGWELRLHEKGGKQHAMPCHHALAEALHAYVAASWMTARDSCSAPAAAAVATCCPNCRWRRPTPGGWSASVPPLRGSRRRSAATPSGRPASPPISPMAARSSTRRPWSLAARPGIA